MLRPPATVGFCSVVLAATTTVRVAASEKVTSRPTAVLPPGQTQADLRAYLLRHASTFIPPSDPGEWAAQADKLRQRVLNEVVLRGVQPDWLAGGPNVLWADTLAGEGYQIRKLRYEVVPGLWVGGLLYEPAGLKGKVPAVLNPNGHVGKPGMTIDYKQVRCINLAKRGMLALNLEWIGMGQLSGAGYGHNDLAYLDLCGRAGLSVFYLALKRGLDVLCSHEAADLERVAVTGLSGGGWQTILISSLDTRVKLAAPNAGYIGLEHRVWNDGDIGDREQNATDLVSVADYPVLTALLYPRPALLIYNAQDDCCFPAERARTSVYRPVLALYELAGLADRFAFHVNHDPGTHNYLQDNRQAFYRFLNHHFLLEGQRKDDEIPVDDELRKAEELAIEYPADNASFHTLAAEAIKSLPTRKVPRGDETVVSEWCQETRRMLLDVVRPDEGATVSQWLIMPTAPDSVEEAGGFAAWVRIGKQWTLPMVEYTAKDAQPAANCLILADGGRSGARDIVADAIRADPNRCVGRASSPSIDRQDAAPTEALGRTLSARHRAIVVDLLFTGECIPGKGGGWKYAQMISTVGRRCLGIQVSQLDAIIDHVKQQYPSQPLRIVTKGRVAGLAALVSAALKPGQVEHIELREMDASLKDLLAKKVGYNQAPSMFCFGLLECVDVPELIQLAHPTKIDIVEAGPPAK